MKSRTSGFLRAWAGEAGRWCTVALVAVLWTSVIVLLAHGMAWLATGLGPTLSLAILIIAIAMVIAGGSAWVVYRRLAVTGSDHTYPPVASDRE